MNSTIDFLKSKLSIAEVLTLIFIFSVGLSLVYKLGFYSELGVGWYINTLSPQLIVLSSVKLVFFSLIGILFGVAAAFFSRVYFEPVLGISLILFILFGITTYFNIDLLKRDIYILINFMVCFLTATKINFFGHNSSGSPLSSIPWEQRSLFDKVAPSLVTVFSVFFLVWIMYSEGKNAAKDILKYKYDQTIVQIKDSKDKWILIEMNGDKALIKKNVLYPFTFKIVEYKDMETLTKK